MSFGGPDPLTGLSAPADSLAVAGRKCEYKGRKKKDVGRQSKEGKGKLRTHEVFL